MYSSVLIIKGLWILDVYYQWESLLLFEATCSNFNEINVNTTELLFIWIDMFNGHERLPNLI